MGGVFAPKTCLVLALTAVLAAGCGSGSSSGSSTPTGGTTGGTSAGSGLELRPVYARYASGVPLGTGDVALGPQVPKALVGAMKAYRCGSAPSTLQGMLMECDLGKTVYLLKAPIISGDVESATPKQIGHKNLWFVEVQYDATGAAALAKANTTMAGTEVAFALPGHVLTAPIINPSMSNGKVGITGNYNRQQAEKLARQISGG